MKRLMLLFLFTLFLSSTGLACDVQLTIAGDKKDTYKNGDVLIVEVTLVYTHRICQIQLSDTKFVYDGMKILDASPWKERATGVFTRQLKIELLNDEKNEATLSLIRKCNRTGGYELLKIRKE